MGVLRSTASPGSEEFQDNQRAHEALIGDLRAQLERVRQGGGERARERHVAPRQAPPPRAR